MIIIRTNILLLLNLYGIAWFPTFIFVWKEASWVTINEEKIHIVQWVHLAIVAAIVEIAWTQLTDWPIWIGFIVAYFSRWLWYLVEYTVYRLQGLAHYQAYNKISFEREAKDHAWEKDYWKKRPFWGNIKYLTNGK